MYKHNLFLLLCLLLAFNDVSATHGAGLDISYRCSSQGTNSDTYEITVRYYRDCSSPTPAGSFFLLEYSSSCNSGTDLLPQISGPIFITPLCLGSSNPCTNGSLVELEEYIYQTTISLTHCDDWTIKVCATGNRNNVISTILNPGSQNLCVEASINNLNLCNNSPSFTEYPAPYICVGQTYCYNNGAFDIDGDSLVYSLEIPDNGNGGVTYLGGYSAQNPVTGTTNFNPITGDLCMNATQAEVSVLAMKIIEYRNGIEIGSVMRDIQVIVLSCLTTPPVLSGFDGIPINVTNSTIMDDSLHFCANDVNTISLDILASLGSSTNKNMYWTGLNNVPSATFNVNNNNSNNPIGTFNWTPQYNDVVNSPFNFTVTVEDDACPVNNIFSYTYTITISSNAGFNINFNPIVNPSCEGYNNGSIDVQLSGIIGAPTFDWTGPNGFTSTNQTIFSLYAGGYNLTITDEAGCILSDSVYIVDPPVLNVTSVIDSISCVGVNDGAINITVSPFSNNLIYTWTGPNNFISTDEDISSLYSGIYNLTITDASGCTFNDTITIPPADPFNVSFVIDSISCAGYNDGEIDLIVSANSTLTYNWTGPNSFSSNNQDISSLLAGNYQIIITDQNGCTFLDTIIIADPIFITSTNIVSNACDNYFWNGTTYSSSGTYTYNTTALNGCDSIALLDLIINSSSIDTLEITACDEYSLNGSTYSSSGMYNWTGNNINGCDSSIVLDLTLNNSTLSSILVQECNPYFWNGTTYTSSGIYTYITTNNFGCDSLATLNLNITSYDIGVQTPICESDSTNITIEITDPTVNEYTVVINDGFSISTYIVDSLGLLIPEGINIRLPFQVSSNLILESVTDINNCNSLPNKTALVFVNQLPNVQLSVFDICINESSFILNQGSPSGGIYFIDQDQKEVLKPFEMSIGKHLIEYYYTDPLTNCSNSDQDTISILPIPYADFYCDKYVAKQDTPITFFNNSSSFVSLTWDFGDNYPITDDLIIEHLYEDTGTYLVELIVENEYDCYDTARANILILPSYIVHIPTAFIPESNDTLNNSFRPFGEGINSYELTIFNRWGEEIFNEKDTKWDAKNCQEGTYIYVIKILNLKNREFYYRGYVHVIR